MSLRDQLKDVLPQILPTNPAEAVKGTELIRLVKYRLRQEYSDATLRYHFSILCCDPSSPIAKVDQGQGYYLRTARMTNWGEARALAAGLGAYGADLFQNGPALDQVVARAAKLRAIYERVALGENRFACTFGTGSTLQNVWRYPDVSVVDWELDEATEAGSFALSRSLIEMKLSLGVQPFTLVSLKLVPAITHENLREVFYQTLSTSSWAHAGELIIGAPVLDGQLADELRRLGGEHGLGISSLGLSVEALDELAEASTITAMDERAFESFQTTRLSPQKITRPAIRSSLQWRQISELRRDSEDFAAFFTWIEGCLRAGQAAPFERPKPVGGDVVPFTAAAGA
jgi:hypothetical protein